MPGAYLGIREIAKNVWPAANQRGGVFPNFGIATAPTVRPDATALVSGDIYYNTTSDTLFVRTVAGAWTSIGSVGAISLGTAYTNGQAITRDSGTIAITDDRTNTTDTLSISKTGAGSGDLIDLSYTTTATGRALNIVLTNAATATQALRIVGQAVVRITNPLVSISEEGTGAVATVNIAGAAATTGPLLSVTASAAVAPVADTDGMVTLNTTSSANAAQGLLIYNNTAAHTGALLRIYDNAATGASTALSIAYGAASTGDAVNITMTNAGTAAQALVITGQVGVRITNALVAISEEGTGALPTVDIAANATTTGPLLRLRRTAGAAAPVADTNGMATIDTSGTANAAQGLLIYNNTAAHTGALLRIYDAAGTGAGTGLGIAYGAAATGDAINITMTSAGAAAQALVIVGHTAATSDVVSITGNGTGAGNAVAIIGGGTMSGDLLDLSASAAITGDFLAITMTNAGAGADGITLTGSPVGRTGNMLQFTDAQTTGSGATIAVTKSGALAVGDVFDVTCSSTGAGAVFDIDLTAAYTGIVFDIDGSVGIHTGNIFDFATTQAYTGIVLNLTMTNSAVTGQALVVAGQAGAATSSLCSITANGTGDSHHALDLVAGGAISATDGVLLDLSASAAIAGDFVLLTMTNAGNGADGIVLTGSPVGRTGNMLQFTDAQTTGSGATVAVTKSGALAVGDVLDITCSNTGAGAVFDIDLTAAYTGVIFDIDGSVGLHTGDIFNFNTTQAYVGDIFDITLTNCGATVQALVITESATIRSGHLIEITGGAADTGDVINVALGAFTGSGNVLAVTTGAAAWTGDMIDWTPNASSISMRALDLNGAGIRTVNVIDIDCSGADTASALAIDTAGVGAAGVAAAMTLTGTGDLAAGGDLARFVSTGSPSASSNVVAIEQSTGAGSAGAYALYVSATGTNVEGIYVDDGNVVIDEQLSRYRLRTSAPADGAVAVAATDSGSVFTNRNFTIARTYTLPTLSAGLHFWFVGVANVGYTITSALGDDITSLNDAAADSVAFTTAGQIIGSWLYVICDGTTWYAISTTAGVGGTYTITVAT